MIVSFRSDLVRQELLPLTSVPQEWGRNLRGIKIPSDTVDFSRETGVAGVTSSFSPERGQELREACIERLEALIEDFRSLS